MKRKLGKGLAPLLAATLCSGTVLGAGDGADEPGFVPPPVNRKKPPAPPRTASSAETMDACCCCPVTPMSRTEAKKPPQPPVLITKLRETRGRVRAKARPQPAAEKKAKKADAE
jgi:hypothetical protein